MSHSDTISIPMPDSGPVTRRDYERPTDMGRIASAISRIETQAREAHEAALECLTHESRLVIRIERIMDELHRVASAARSFDSLGSQGSGGER